MPLTKPNQDLRDLRDAAAVLKWSGVDLFTFAKKLLAAGDEDGANELMKIALAFQEIEGQASRGMEEVKAGRVTRTKE